MRARLEALLAAHEQPETLLAMQAATARPTLGPNRLVALKAATHRLPCISSTAIEGNPLTLLQLAAGLVPRVGSQQSGRYILVDRIQHLPDFLCAWWTVEMTGARRMAA